MDDLILAWRNVWRNPRRSLLTVLAITFAAGLLVFMLSFQLGSYETMINASIRLSTGHLQVQDARYDAEREMRMTVDAPERAARLDALLQDPDRTETLMAEVVAPLERRETERREARLKESAATRVEFFTMVRGEDDETGG